MLAVRYASSSLIFSLELTIFVASQEFNEALAAGTLTFFYSVPFLAELLLLCTVTKSAQAEPTATGEYIELTSHLRDAVSGRSQAEHDLRAYRREVQAELEEKERWGELLRQHGLLPPV
jgi:hypothetical protein